MLYLEAFNAEDLIYIFVKTIMTQYRTPDEIILNKDKLFTSQFWQSIIDQLGMKYKLFTSYHPQTDGRTERTNQTIEQYLKYYLNY